MVAGLEEILQNKQALDAFLCKLSVTCQTKYCLQMNEDGYITINFFNNVRCNTITQSIAKLKKIISNNTAYFVS